MKGPRKIHSDVYVECVEACPLLGVTGANTSVLLVVVHWGGCSWKIASSASLAIGVLLLLELWLVSVQTSSGPVDLYLAEKRLRGGQLIVTNKI